MLVSLLKPRSNTLRLGQENTQENSERFEIQLSCKWSSVRDGNHTPAGAAAWPGMKWCWNHCWWNGRMDIDDTIVVMWWFYIHIYIYIYIYIYMDGYELICIHLRHDDNVTMWQWHVVGYYVMLKIFSNFLNFRDSKMSIASFNSSY